MIVRKILLFEAHAEIFMADMIHCLRVTSKHFIEKVGYGYADGYR